MSDEAVAAVPGLPALQYTLKHYLLYLGPVQERARALSQGEGTIGGLAGYTGLQSGWSVQSCSEGQGARALSPEPLCLPR